MVAVVITFIMEIVSTFAFFLYPRYIDIKKYFYFELEKKSDKIIYSLYKYIFPAHPILYMFISGILFWVSVFVYIFCK